MSETIQGLEEAILEARLEDLAAMPPDTEGAVLAPLRLEAVVAANAIHSQAVSRIESAREAGRAIPPQPIPRSMRMPRLLGQDVVVSHKNTYKRLGIDVVFDERDETLCHLQP
ncbi:MAG: hypothetical protein JWM37_874 [Candidatus Saccharibacteria bacterium]|nr:hypothetical protein [Candidatus Saccharibacteria bacterium]